MISLDTNVLVRLLVDDPDNPQQNKSARALAIKHKKLFISQIVQAEFYWVLEKCYSFSKDLLLAALNELSMNEAFVLDNDKCFNQAKQLYQSHNVDFTDVLILTHSKFAHAKQLLTFDKKLARLPDVQFIK